MPRTLLAILVIGAVSGCLSSVDERGSGAHGGKADRGADPAPSRATQDILRTTLSIDLAALEAQATVSVLPPADGAISLDVTGLVLTSVAVGDVEQDFTVDAGRVRIDAGERRDAVDVAFSYRFEDRTPSDGWSTTSGTSMLWPYFCGNLFPCDPDPSDGVLFELDVTNVPEGSVAVYPETTTGDGPSYMLALAVGDYEHEDLGTTSAGTEVSVYYYRGERDDALEGAGELVAIFDFLERTYGPYRFGDRVASVSADWGESAFGGMEHHPYWHVGRAAMSDDETHAHEAAHGWFGNGVRIDCWEDFVLSEGVTTYAAARAIGSLGEEHEARIWASYEEQLAATVESEDTIAWPEGCDEIDLLHHPLWSSVPYMKGAFFLRAVAAEVGARELDHALGRFYHDHAGTAARMSDLLDTIEEETGFDPRPLAEAWLRSLGAPE